MDGEWLWPGDPVDLAQVELLGAFRSAPSVVKAVSEFWLQVPGVLSTLRAEIEIGCLLNPWGGTKSADKSWSDTTRTDVTWVPNLFAVGRSTFYRDGMCEATADCDCLGMISNWSYTCTLGFSIKDWFRDPTDTGSEIKGGVPYPINASWIETITWPVPIGPISGP